MANLLQAMQAYGPKLEHREMVYLKELADWMSMRTGLNKSEVMMVLQELNDALLYFNCKGRPVKLPDIGIFSPSIKRDGQLKVNFRTDTALKKGINMPEAYTAPIQNKQNIGLDNAGYKELWDNEHPDDALEISAGTT